MTRHRFYLSPGSSATDSVLLDESESHHLKDVLRLRPGATVFVFDGAGHEYTCRIEGFEHRRARLAVLERTQPAVESPVDIILAQAITKGEKFDFIIQKATELGVRRVVPLMTVYAKSSSGKSVSVDRLERWRRIALEATKQCGRTQLTEIMQPMSLDRFLIELSHPALLFSERGGSSLSVLQSSWWDRSSSVCLLIGPEGGWQESELEAARSTGAVAVSLGPRILRTETAAIVAVCLVQHLWGDLS